MAIPDPGSFRDPASHVVHEGDRVLRHLDERGLEAWRILSASAFFANAVEGGRLIGTTEIAADYPGVAATLEHPRLPVITYPYEWTFSMLKDAALLQLDLLVEALGEGITIKDATPFNIQFHRGRPVFIDIGSFEQYRQGEPWIGYRQFTRQFLFPLLLRAWVGIPHQTWLRGDMEGPTAAQMKRLLPAGKRFKPAALMHISLQARMEDSLSGRAVRSDLKAAGFNADLILANVRKLRSLIETLTWEPEIEGWVDYASCTHVGRDRDLKTEFLERSLHRHGSKVVADLGANDGHFSIVAARSGAMAVAIDGDEPVLDHLYRSGMDEDLAIVVSDLTNPTPAMGWAARERPGLFERVRPDLVLAYGLIHHLIYTASIPPRTVLEWLRGFDCPVIVEFVSPSDAMVATLTANKLDTELHPGRDEQEFRAMLRELFVINAEHTLEGDTRVLFDLSPLSD